MTPRSLASLLLSLSVAALGCGDNSRLALDAGATTPDASPDAATPAVPSIAFFDYAIAVDLTPDGRLAVFEDLSTGQVTAIKVDTVTGAVAPPIAVGDPSVDLVTGVSANGQLTALHGNPVEAGVFDGTAWRDLASPYATPCDVNAGGTWDISADASVVVGFMWNGCSPVAFRWHAGDAAVTTFDVLGARSAGTAGAPTNRATVVSDDGTVAAGFAENLALDRSPAIWTADGHGFLIEPANQDAPGEVLSISADGTHVAGIWGNEGFVWTQADGRVPIPLLATSLPGDPVFPNAMIADGTLVFGGMGDAFFTTPAAFVWSAAAGTRSLTDLAVASGIAIPDGTLLGSVLGASADGTVTIGTATTAAGAQQTFILRLPASAL